MPSSTVAARRGCGSRPARAGCTSKWLTTIRAIPQRLDQDTDALDGRGIAIVAQLATSWGVRDDPYGKTVWFDVAG